MSMNDVPTLQEWAENNRESGVSGYDSEQYLAYLGGMDIPVAQKIELITVLLAVMESFVDRAFGDDPVQQARKDVGEPKLDNAPPRTSVADSRTDIPDNKNLSRAFQRQSSDRPGKEESLR